jgi:hypothetical protein
MFVGTLRMNRALQFVFATLALLFFMLALGNGLNEPNIIQTAGYLGIVCGLSAMYTGLAQVLNEVCGYELLPLFGVKKTELAPSPEMDIAGK